MKTLIFDVMLNEQYIHTFKYRYNPLFPIEEEELRKFVEERLPTLKGKKFKILFQGMNLNAIIKKWFCRHEWKEGKRQLNNCLFASSKLEKIVNYINQNIQ